MKQLQKTLGIIVIASLAWSQQTARQTANSNDTDDLQIIVLEGEDGANIVSDQTFAETIVEVRDRNNLPILGGAVTFGVVWAALHAGGGSPGTFANGSSTLTVTTDANGRAVMTGFRPQANGAVNIQVQARYQGHTGRTTIHQTNFPTVAAAMAAGKNPANNTSSNGNGSGTNGNGASDNGGNGSLGNIAAPAASTGQNATQAASHGISTGAKVALIGLAVAGAGAGAAYGAGLFNKNSGSSNCAAIASQAADAYGTAALQCAAPAKQACSGDINSAANLISQFCACASGDAQVYSVALSQWNGLKLIASTVGSTLSGGNCH